MEVPAVLTPDAPQVQGSHGIKVGEGTATWSAAVQSWNKAMYALHGDGPHSVQKVWDGVGFALWCWPEINLYGVELQTSQLTQGAICSQYVCLLTQDLLKNTRVPKCGTLWIQVIPVFSHNSNAFKQLIKDLVHGSSGTKVVVMHSDKPTVALRPGHPSSKLSAC